MKTWRTVVDSVPKEEWKLIMRYPYYHGGNYKSSIGHV